MNTDTKWEAVEIDDVNADDNLRLTHENGDVIHGIYRMRPVIGTSDFIETRVGHVSVSRIRGYSFERAVPERTLPTGWGVFASRAEVDRAGENRLHFDVWMHDEDGWKNLYTNPDVAVIADAVPDDMEPLGLSAEAGDLRARIEKTRAYIEAISEAALVGAVRGRAIKLLAGEA